MSIPRTTAFFFSESYRALKVSESAFFALAPLPLRQLKSGIQAIGVPLLMTGVASQIPGLNHAVMTAVQFSGNTFATGGQVIAQSSLNAIGQAIASNLPTGLGIQTVAHGLGNAIAPVVTGATVNTARFLGQTVGAVSIGQILLKGGMSFGDRIRTQGLGKTLNDVLVSGQQAVQRSKSFLQSAQSKLQALPQGVSVMPQIPENFGVKAAEGLTLDKVRATNNPILEHIYVHMEGLRQDLNEAYQHAKENKMPSFLQSDLVRGMEAEFKSLKRELEREIKASIQRGELTPQSNQVSEDRSVEAMRDATAKVIDQTDPRESLNGSPDVKGTDQMDSTERLNGSTDAKGIDPIDPRESLNGSPDMKKVEPEPTSAKAIAKEAPESAVKPKAKADRETEDYALTVQQMLAQRGINTGRFQIHINEAVVFKMKEGNIERSKLTPEQTEAIKLALSDPAALKGTVKISQGGNILLHVKDGQVLVDSLGLVKPAAKVEVTTPQSPGELLYNNASKGVSAEGMRRTSEVVVNAFRSGATKEQVMEMVKGHDPAYKEAVESKGQRAADKAFEQLVEHSQAKVHLESQPKQERAQSQARVLQR